MLELVLVVVRVMERSIEGCVCCRNYIYHPNFGPLNARNIIPLLLHHHRLLLVVVGYYGVPCCLLSQQQQQQLQIHHQSKPRPSVCVCVCALENKILIQLDRSIYLSI
jgi:hypothetical protein